MDDAIAPVTCSLPAHLDHHADSVVNPISLDRHQPAVITGHISTTQQPPDHAGLLDILHNTDCIRPATQLVALETVKEKPPSIGAAANQLQLVKGRESAAAAMERLLESSLVATPHYSLPSFVSSFTASSVDNNNVSINCSFTNSSVDSRDDDACAMHVTFDDDYRPQLRPRDASQIGTGMDQIGTGLDQISTGSQISTGLEFLEVACPVENSASVEVPSTAANNPVASGSVQAVSEATGGVSDMPEVSRSLACSDSAALSDAAQLECPPTMSSAMCADARASTVEMAAESLPRVNTAVDSAPQHESNADEPVPSGGEERKKGVELCADQASMQEVSTLLDRGLTAEEACCVPCNHGNVPVSQTASNPDAKSSTAVSRMTDNLLAPPASDGQSRGGTVESSPAAVVEVDRGRCSPSSRSSIAVLTPPVRKSARAVKNPLNTAEFVSLDLSPRRRVTAKPPTSATPPSQTTARTDIKPRQHAPAPTNDSSRTATRNSASSERATTSSRRSQSAENRSAVVVEQLSVKSDRTRPDNIASAAETGELRRKRGRPRKNRAVVNGESGSTQLTWSSLNSKAAGDSSLGNIGLVSELFSVKSFASVSSQLSAPAAHSDAVVSMNIQQSVTAKAQSPVVADLSFSPLDDLSSLDPKHKKKKKKRKKKKKSRHSSLVDAGKDDLKVVDNLGGLTEELRKVQLAASETVGRPPENSRQSPLDGFRILAEIFAQTCSVKNTAACQRSFAVRGKTCGGSVAAVPSVTGSRWRSARKASPLVCGGGDDADRKQSCLPPKKRHKLQMQVPPGAAAADVSRGYAVSRARRGRPPKLQLLRRQKLQRKTTSKFCCT